MVNGEGSSGSVMLPCAWWHQDQRITSLDAVKVAADALEKGLPVPGPYAMLLAKALRQYLAGQTDITRNLGLRPRKGGRYETPAFKARQAERDAGIRRLFDMIDGSPSERASAVAELLKSTAQIDQVTQAEVRAQLQDLHREHGATLPTSKRQVQRLVNRG